MPQWIMFVSQHLLAAEAEAEEAEEEAAEAAS